MDRMFNPGLKLWNSDYSLIKMLGYKKGWLSIILEMPRSSSPLQSMSPGSIFPYHIIHVANNDTGGHHD